MPTANYENKLAAILHITADDIVSIDEERRDGR